MDLFRPVIRSGPRLNLLVSSFLLGWSFLTFPFESTTYYKVAGFYFWGMYFSSFLLAESSYDALPIHV
tara:strand:+ start:263 stop:466 length:204 start_codon:yes stop_codon:yes gene_type:complete